MKFYEVIESRRSIRAYLPDKPVTDEQLKRILRAARLAPTAANKQPYKIVIIKNPKEYLDFIKQKNVLQAPLVIAIFVNEDAAWVRKYDEKNFAWVDGSIVFEHLILAATAEGLATVWIANTDPLAMEETCKIPHNFRFLALTPLGYAAEKPKDTIRKSEDELITYLE
ncbi:MAG: nitroreductase family protein [Candidatus Heimdallarchaeota archaeon]|nr:MAG: nitroreductase family protein [Candidatus Heimdallarchaeota archaeon]